MKKTAFILMLIAIFSKGLGFLREIVLSYTYGASNISDAYLVSLTVPSVIFDFISIGLLTAYIPLFSKISSKSTEEKGIDFSNNLINILLLICIFLISGIYGFTEPVVKVFASGFDESTLNLAITLTKISSVAMFFWVIVPILSGFLQWKNNYIIPALIGVPMNFIVIISIFISPHLGVKFLSIGFLFSIFTQILLLYPFSYRKGYRYKFKIDFKDENIKRMLLISIPVILGSSITQINTLIDRTLASNVAVGGISALNYADKLNGFVQGLFVAPIITVSYPAISRMVAEKNINGLKKITKDSINTISILVLPMMVGTMLFCEPIILILFGRGAFGKEALYMTSSALFYYSIGMLAFALREVIARSFYAMEDTKTPMINASISVVINIVLNIALSQYMGIAGLALATSISTIISTFLLLLNLRKKIGSLGLKIMIRKLAILVLSSIIMGGISKIVYEFLKEINIGDIFNLLISVMLGVTLYVGMLYTWKIPEVTSLFQRIRKSKNIIKKN